MGIIHRLGARQLLIHMIISCIGWLVIDTKAFGYQLFVVTIISLVLIILWHRVIHVAGKSGFLHSFVVSLYFTVPSLITGIFYYSSYLNQDQMDFEFFNLVWSLVNYPLDFGCTVLHIQSPLIASIRTQIALPVIMMNLLVVINLIGNIVKRKFISTYTS